MTRTVTGLLLTLALGLAACGGPATPATGTPGAGATTPAAGATTPAPAASTPATVATTPPAATPPPGSGTITVVLTGGANAGTYTGGADPHCSYGFLSPDVWGVAYADPAVTGPTGIGAANVISQAAAQSDPIRPFGADVWIGAAFEGTNYALVRDAGDASQTIEITDNGTTAVIHVVGATTVGATAGVGVEMTVNCPSVIRG